MKKQKELVKVDLGYKLSGTSNIPLDYNKPYWGLQEMTKQGERYVKVKCPDCGWSQFKDGEAVAMTPCFRCNSTGYVFEPLIEEGV